MTTKPSTESVTLYYRDGSSDKVYQANIEAAEGGYVVNFAFGRRGNTLQTGTKTPKPVDYDTARKAYDKLVREKMAKGYTPGQDGTPYQHTSKEERATGIFPQILNPIDEEQALRLIEDPDCCAQEKFDGKRILVRKDGDQVTGINRKGLTVALPQPIADSALPIGGRRWLMDGEAIGDLYVAFDLLERDGADLREGPYRRRLDALTAIVTPGPKGAIRVVDTASRSLRPTIGIRFAGCHLGARAGHRPAQV
jgi:bifunctional non-homologous end joining protein LigD